MPLTPSLRDDYESRFASCAVRPERKREIEALITRMLKSQDRYQQLAIVTGVPWFVIAVIHNMECGGRFDCHLHNGDPLSARTVQVPAGRPHDGQPPFTWEASAKDALLYQGFDVWKDWSSIAGMLYKLEAYNGFGYRKHNVPSPYLWGGSQHYVQGKYVQDGLFSTTAVSKQIGVAVVIRRMLEQALIQLGERAA
jgi:lysozyme family protein